MAKENEFTFSSATINPNKSIKAGFDLATGNWEANQDVSQYLKNGGALVYSTCSIEEEENWEIVDNFLNSNANFKLDRADKFISSEYVDKNGCLSIFPSSDGLDGVFAARLIKND